MKPYVQLSDVCKVVMGQSPSGSTYNTSGKGFPLLAGAGDFGDLIPVPKKFTTNPTRVSKEDDLILCIRATIGDLNWSNGEYCLGRGVAALRPNEKFLDKNYLWFFIKDQNQVLKRKGTGSTFKQINRIHIEELKIPLPPLEEQKRIAAILDKADALRRKRQQAIELADQLLRSVFLDMFGDPVTNPKGWIIETVGKHTDCIVPGRDKPKSFTGKTPWITTKDLQNLNVTFTSSGPYLGLSPEEILENKCKIIPPNSVIMTCAGEVGILSVSGAEMVLNQQLHSFQCRENLNPFFLMYALSFQKKYMEKMSSNTTIPYMNKQKCNSIPVIIPPIDSQIHFETIFHRLSQHLLSSKNFSFSVLNLHESLAQMAFNGRL